MVVDFPANVSVLHTCMYKCISMYMACIFSLFFLKNFVWTNIKVFKTSRIWSSISTTQPGCSPRSFFTSRACKNKNHLCQFFQMAQIWCVNGWTFHEYSPDIIYYISQFRDDSMILELKEYIFNKMFSISEEGVQIASIAKNMLPYDGSLFIFSVRK